MILIMCTNFNIITTSKMKKKLKISVFDIIHKASTNKMTPKNANITQIDSPLIIDKPIRFEDLYKKAIENHHKPGDSNCLKVIYDSKKTTPIQTNRVKKTSVHSIVKNTKSALSSITKNENIASNCITPKAASTVNHSLKNSKQKQKSHSKSRSKPKINQDNNYQSLKKTMPKPIKIQQCFHFLNHEQHSHLRERNECFLSEREIDFILTKLGFDIKHSKYADFMSIMEVDIYGGAPSQNLKQILKILQSCYSSRQVPQTKERLPKIIDNNLQLNLTRQSEQFIRRYFADFAAFQNISAQKQNKGGLANQSSSKKIESFESMLREKKNSTLQLNKQLLYSSPSKKINNSAISQLIEALTQSQKKKQGQKVAVKTDQSNKENQPIVQQNEQNMNTFRKIESSGFDNQQNQYNFSRQLSGDKIVQLTEDSNIIELKNRLNEALKHSQFSHNFQPEHQIETFSSYLASPKPEQKAILSVDVNLGEGVNQKIIVYQGETAKQVADRLAAKFTISPQTKIKFEKMLDSHLNTMLWKIEQLSEQMLTDRQIQ